LNSRWALLKGYRKAAGKCPKAIGQPLENSQRVLESCWKCPNKAEVPSSYWQKGGNFHPFFLKRCIFVHFILKLKEPEKCLKCSAGLFLFWLFPTIPLLAGLKVVRQCL
jgi:hypothetical protein